jgi:glycosyltransferase involved in cell wall biosynthesis
LADDLRLSAYVNFPGLLDLPAKVQAGQEHDTYLNTNRIDNLPVSVLEMAAMGLPIVSTNVGGIPDLLVNGQDALLVPDNDPEAMAKAVNRLIDDCELTAQLSENGRKLAERFAWENIKPLWQNLLFDS